MPAGICVCGRQYSSKDDAESQTKAGQRNAERMVRLVGELSLRCSVQRLSLVPALEGGSSATLAQGRAVEL